MQREGFIIGPGLPKRSWYRRILQARESLSEGRIDVAQSEVAIPSRAVDLAAQFLLQHLLDVPCLIVVVSVKNARPVL